MRRCSCTGPRLPGLYIFQVGTSEPTEKMLHESIEARSKAYLLAGSAEPSQKTARYYRIY